MEKLQWFEREFQFGFSHGMLPYFLERLDGTISRVRDKVKDVSDELLSHRLDNKWSVKQNIGHLAEVDEVSSKRIVEMIGGITWLSPAVFEPTKNYNEQTIEQVLRDFEQNRRWNINHFIKLNDSELKKSSMHPRLKVNMTPVDLAWFDAEHDDHHLVRINEILKTLVK